MRTAPQKKKAPPETKEIKRVISTWSFQTWLVKLFTLPFPFAVCYLGFWAFHGDHKKIPLTALAVLMGSVAGTLVCAFAFWRCPACNEIVYKTSDSQASSLLFWLGDPKNCRACGARLH